MLGYQRRGLQRLDGHQHQVQSLLVTREALEGYLSRARRPIGAYQINVLVRPQIYPPRHATRGATSPSLTQTLGSPAPG